uniref:Uncharacterized protein n=1 Tax=Arundo donax TaxID=35708 RepID=A0A0A8Y637_ARUDO
MVHTARNFATVNFLRERDPSKKTFQ